MAWRSSGATNEALVENLCHHGLITDARVKEAFLKVDRAHYAPASPYEDSPQLIGHGATISAPHMHASAIEHLLPSIVAKASQTQQQNTRPTTGTRKNGIRILDIGSGSGYLVHVLSLLAGPGSVVVGVEHIPALRDLGQRNMGKSTEGRVLLRAGRARFRVGDGREGWKEAAEAEAEVRGDIVEWDVIHVGASAREVHPRLVGLLKSPGRMFIPVDDDESGWGQHVWLVEKDERGEVSMKRLFGVSYVPLKDAPK